jgi:hypothetical protein
VSTLERDLAAARKDVKSARGVAHKAKAALEERQAAARQLQVPTVVLHPGLHGCLLWMLQCSTVISFLLLFTAGHFQF